MIQIDWSSHSGVETKNRYLNIKLSKKKTNVDIIFIHNVRCVNLALSRYNYIQIDWWSHSGDKSIYENR